MIVVNFAHPLTTRQQDQIAQLAQQEIARVIDVPTQFDDEQPFAPQVAALVAAAGLTAAEWQTLPLLVNLPTYAPITAVLLAYLHGLCGHFPTIVRLRPVLDGPIADFEVAETIRLDTIRHAARRDDREGSR